MEISAIITNMIKSGEFGDLATAVANEIAAEWVQNGWQEGDAVGLGGGDYEYAMTVLSAAHDAGWIGGRDFDARVTSEIESILESA